jgi:hypothetical protein
MVLSAGHCNQTVFVRHTTKLRHLVCNTPQGIFGKDGERSFRKSPSWPWSTHLVRCNERGPVRGSPSPLTPVPPIVNSRLPPPFSIYSASPSPSPHPATPPIPPPSFLALWAMAEEGGNFGARLSSFGSLSKLRVGGNSGGRLTSLGFPSKLDLSWVPDG